ncbi:MAG: hypothetical protein R6V85_00130 [Polyangia bacterium]
MLRDDTQSLVGLLMAFAVLWASGCCAVPSQTGAAEDTSGSSDEEPDAGQDTSSGTDTGPVSASFVTPPEDLLPDWSMSWLEVAGDHGSEVVNEIAASGSDRFVASGWADQSEYLVFGSISVPVWPENMFLVEYTIDGKVLWAAWAGEGPCVAPLDLDALQDGRIAVAGVCGQDACFGPGEPNETWLHTGPSTAYSTSYLAVYEPGGKLAWARDLSLEGSISRAEGYAVDILESGEVLSAGSFEGEVTAAKGTSSETVLSTVEDYTIGEENVFLLEYDSAGELIWARSEGGPGQTIANGMAALEDGSFFLVGAFNGTTVFGEGTEAETTLVSEDVASVFLARFTAEGQLSWVVDLGVDGSLGNFDSGKVGEPLLADNGDVLVPGRFRGTMPAGDGEEVTPVDAGDGWGLFLARYTADGSRVWNRVSVSDDAPGISLGGFYGVAELADGTLVAAGMMKGEMAFGPGEVDELTIETLGTCDGVIAAYSPSGDFLWALPQGDHGSDYYSDVESFVGEEGQDVLIAGGGFSEQTTFGTGGDDVVTVTATEPSGDSWWPYDLFLQRFDREAP